MLAQLIDLFQINNAIFNRFEITTSDGLIRDKAPNILQTVINKRKTNNCSS